MKRNTPVLLTLVLIILLIIEVNWLGNKEQDTIPEAKTPPAQNSGIQNSLKPPNTVFPKNKPAKNEEKELDPSTIDLDNLTDEEIRILREKIKLKSGGEYYLHTPGRSVKTIKEEIKEVVKEKDWAEKNVRQ